MGIKRSILLLGVLGLVMLTVQGASWASPLERVGVSSPNVDDPFYPDYGDVLDALQDLAADYPSIVDYHVIGNETHGSRDLVAVKISDNVGDEEDEPAWVFTGFVHGSEQIGLRILLDLATELAEEYGSDADITDYIDAYEIWFVLAGNPWGYDHDSSGGGSVTGTRKNGESTSDENTSGVDLARNYDFRWDQAPVETEDPENSRFRGPAPFSEDETQALRDLFLGHGPLFGITFHQGNDPDGGQIMRPWSGSGSNVPPDADRLLDVAEDLADWVFSSRSGGPFCDFSLEDPDGDGHCANEGDEEFCDELCWEPEQATLGRYGQPSNWYYHELGTFDYTVEVSDRAFNGTFLHEGDSPSGGNEEDVKAIAEEFSRNWIDAIFAWFDDFLANSSPPYQFKGPGLTGHITDALLENPISATVEIAGYTSSLIEDRHSDPEFGRYWRLLPAGTHGVTVSKPGYQNWNGNVVVGGGNLTILDVELTPDLEIILPDATFPAWVGEPDNTRPFTVRLRLGSAGEACVGPLPFSVFVRDETNSWVEANTGVQACVQDSYWVAVQAPDSGDGSFVSDGLYDLRVELDTVADESLDAIRYSERDQDAIIVMDISGSMGNGGKLEAAQEAAVLLVNELTENDQGALVTFTGDGVETNNDADTKYELAEMTVANRIPLIAAINGLMDEDLTSIGDGLNEALDESESVRADPDHYCGLILLSDGMENEAAYWSDVEPRAAASDCAIHVVALGPEADETLLEDISQKGTPGTDDDGSYQYATINDSSASTSRVGSTNEQWPNRLAAGYDDIGSRLAQRQRFYKIYGNVKTSPASHTIRVDPSLDEVVFALKWSGSGHVGRLELVRPNGTTVSPADPGVERRSSASDEVYRIAQPQAGLWRARVTNLKPSNDLGMNYVLLGSGQTFIEFQLFTSADVEPLHQGEYVHILGMLMQKGEPIPGANVRVFITAPDGVVSQLRLYDDGQHEDGLADDGFYANVYDRLILGDFINPDLPEGKELRVVGSYMVEGIAQTAAFMRMATAGFAVIPSPDGDQDGMPTPWEIKHGLNPKDPEDARLDPDMDGLSNREEFQAGTDPHDSDTDDGGESDGSEVQGGRDPLWPADDAIAGVQGFHLAPLPNAVLLTWQVHSSHDFYELWRRVVGGAWELANGQIPPTGEYRDLGLQNGTPYSYKILAIGPKLVRSASTDSLPVIPVIDPFPPEGVVRINKNAASTPTRLIVLNFSASSDTTAMRFASEIDEGTDEIGSPWRPYVGQMDWRIPKEVAPGEAWQVFVQFRDRAGNESTIVSDDILYLPPRRDLYLPLMQR